MLDVSFAIMHFNMAFANMVSNSEKTENKWEPADVTKIIVAGMSKKLQEIIKAKGNPNKF